MYINPKQTLRAIDRCLSESEPTNLPALKRAYQHTVRLHSQLLSVIYDLETFEHAASVKSFAQEQSRGAHLGTAIILTLNESLPSMKKLTEAIEEHWKVMLHAAIGKTAWQGPLPYFEKAFVEIEVVTPTGSNNARLWDASNRAVNVIINSLKGIFFEDDNLEYMAFSVVGDGAKKVLRSSVFLSWTYHVKLKLGVFDHKKGKTMRM